MKVLDVKITTLLTTRLHDDVVRLLAPFYVSVTAQRKSGVTIAIDYKLDAGFTCDGLSVPKPLRWFLKNWDNKNDYYNAAGLIHDAAFAKRGWGLFTYTEVNEIFKGMLMFSGKDKDKSTLAQLAVQAFACCHWGNDEYCSARYANCDYHIVSTK